MNAFVPRRGAWIAALLLVVAAAALWPRWQALEYRSEITWDSGVYFAVADNILERGCVSVSPGRCVPHWGGNQMPGYPAFLAAVKAVAGSGLGLFERFMEPEAWRVIGVAQAFVFAAAAAYLAWSLHRLSGSLLLAAAGGIAVGLSPLTAGWARFPLTESLAAAVVVATAAEAVRSLAEGRLRHWQLGLWLAAAAYVRHDSVFLVPFVLVIAFALHAPRAALRALAITAVVAATPIAAWSARAVHHGIAPTPPVYVFPDGWRPASGVLSWGRTWIVDEPDVTQFLQPVIMGRYDKIRIWPGYFDAAETAQLNELMPQLMRRPGQPVPQALDARFEALAAARVAADPLAHWLGRPLKRAATLWTAPKSLHDFGWPERIEPAPWLKLYLRGLGALALAAAAAAALLRWRVEAALAGAALAAAAAKTALHAYTATVEQRYLTEAVPLLEIAIVVVAGGALLRMTAARAGSAGPVSAG